MELVKESVKTEIPLFIIRKDKAGFEHKIVNFDNPEQCPRSGIIQVKSIRQGTNHKKLDYGFRVQRDRSTGIVYGIPLGLDDRTGEIEYQMIFLHEFRQFDLSIYQDAQEWACIRMHEHLKGSPLQKGKPLFEIYDMEKESIGTVKFSRDRRRAEAIIDELTGNMLTDMARNLGISPESNTPTAIHALMLETVGKNAASVKRFFDIWEGSNRGVLTTFKRAVATGLIELDVAMGYKHKNGMSIGHSEAAALAYLNDNQAFLMSIDRESKALDKYRVAVVEKKEETVDNKIDDVNKYEEAMTRLAEKEAMLDAKMKQFQEMLEAGNAKAAAPAPVKVEEVVIPVIVGGETLEQLQGIAKLHKIKRFEVMPESLLISEIKKKEKE